MVWLWKVEMPEPQAQEPLSELLAVDIVSTGAALTLQFLEGGNKGRLWYQEVTYRSPTPDLSEQTAKAIQMSIKAAVFSTLREHGYMPEATPDKFVTDEQAEIS
jgi:ABC-type uncharacterized transport system YnjBCD permease subunit